MVQATEERPEFVLPEQWCRDTVEESLEALVDSSKSAQRKISEMGTENNRLHETVAAQAGEIEVLKSFLSRVWTEREQEPPPSPTEQAQRLVAAVNQNETRNI